MKILNTKLAVYTVYFCFIICPHFWWSLYVYEKNNSCICQIRLSLNINCLPSRLLTCKPDLNADHPVDVVEPVPVSVVSGAVLSHQLAVKGQHDLIREAAVVQAIEVDLEGY